MIRDLEGPEPPYSARGRRWQRPWQGADAWRASLEEDAWQRIDVRDGSKGPLLVDVVKRRVVSRTPRRQQGHEEMVVVIRDLDRDNQQGEQADFYLSNAAPETPRWEYARGGQSGAPYRRMPPAEQERGWLGGL